MQPPKTALAALPPGPAVFRGWTRAAERPSGGVTGTLWRKGVATLRAHAPEGTGSAWWESGGRLQEAADGIDIEELPLPEGDLGLPLFGNTLEFLKGRHAFINRHVQEYGPVSRASVLGKRVAIVAGSELLNQILVKDPGLLIQGFVPQVVALLGPTSLINSDGKDHMQVRKLMASTFTKTSVSSYTRGIADKAQELCRKWSQKESIRFVDEVRYFALSVVSEVALGIKFPLGGWSMEDLLETFCIWCAGLYAVQVDLPFTKYGKAMKARQLLIGIIDKAAEAVMEDPMRQGGLREMLLARDEDGNGLTAEQIHANILTLMFAGYDTTASAASTTILQLEKHPEVWRKIQKEQDDIIAQYGPDFTEEAVEAMAYTEAAVKEAMRLLPPVPNNFKVAAKTFQINGYRIPEGWMVMTAAGSTAQLFDPRWPMDLEFRPERFLSGAGLDSKQDLVFGLGPHLCIGKHLSVLENKILVATLARGYNFSVSDADPRMVYGPFPTPEDGLQMAVTRRGDAPKD